MHLPFYYQLAVWYTMTALATYIIVDAPLVHWNRLLSHKWRAFYRVLFALAWPYYLFEILKENFRA